MHKTAGIIALILTGLLTLLVSLPLTAQETGAPEIEVFGGSRGPVPFPHLDHQKRVEDCMVCHDLFPQEADALRTLKEKGELKSKKVMNAQCIRCHRAEKKAGNPSGPTRCATCHVRVKKK